MLTVSSKLIAKIKQVALEQVTYIDTRHYRFKKIESVMTPVEGDTNTLDVSAKNNPILASDLHHKKSDQNTTHITESYSLVAITAEGEQTAHQPEPSSFQSDSSIKPSLTAQKSQAKIAILSRGCYHEKLQWYPIAKKSDVLKLVKLQLQNSTTQVLYIIGSTVNDKTPVTYFYLNKYANTLNAWLLIPETCLLANTLTTGQALSYLTLDNSNNVYVAKSIGGVVSAVKGGIIQNLQQFALSQGLAAEQSSELTSQQHISLLKTQLNTLYKLPLTGFVNRQVFTLTAPTKALSRFALPGVLLFTLYLLLANQVSQHQANSVMTELTQVTKQANQVLNQYQDMNDMIKRYQNLASNLPQKTNLLGVWQVLAPLHVADNQLNVSFSSIEQDGDTVTARFSANSASQVLQLLIQQPQVNNAKFVGAVRRQYNMDDATVQFSVRAAPESEKEVTKKSSAEIVTFNTDKNISKTSPQAKMSEVH